MNKKIILNHKMNLEYDQVYPYIDELNKIDKDISIVVCPSNIYLENFINNCTWGVGSQNIHYDEFGDFTGEVSTLQLKSLGIEYSLIGHYERKKYFNESNDVINQKIIACLDTNIQPIVCFGETGSSDDIIKCLDEILKGINNINFIIFAYEPFLIKNVQTVSSIEENINIIKEYLYQRYKVNPNIIYGGGVNKDNIKDIINIDGVSGVLIGSKSSDIDFVKDVVNEFE